MYFQLTFLTCFYILKFCSLSQEDNFACWENYAVFAVSAFQYIILAYVFSKSKPYRKWVFTNVPFVSSLIVLTGVTTWLVVDPSG